MADCWIMIFQKQGSIVMFERKFKFMIGYPPEVCNKRLIELQTELIGTFYRSSYNEVMAASPHCWLSEIQTSILGRHTIRATINTIPVQGGKSCIFGVAFLEGFWCLQFVNVIMTLVGITGIILAFLTRDTLLFSFSIIGILFAPVEIIHFISERNKLIKKIEKALTQPKKKKS